MKAWLYECMDAWMHGCMDAWMHDLDVYLFYVLMFLMQPFNHAFVLINLILDI